jgi:hypothetical protein
MQIGELQQNLRAEAQLRLSLARCRPHFCSSHGCTQGATPFSQVCDDVVGHAPVQSRNVHVLLLAAGIREFGCRSARGSADELT